jgi:hypothetical protein
MEMFEENMHHIQTINGTLNFQDWAIFENLHVAHVDVFLPG